MPIPAHLITGFLGAGKTTTLRHLLAEGARHGERAAVLVNEFGTLGVDGSVLSGKALSVTEIPNGCICCTLAGRLLEALAQIASSITPQRLYIEPTGLARPYELRRLFDDESLAGLYDLRPVLTLVDPALYLKLRGRTPPFYDEQIREADIIVVNKIDRVGAEELKRMRADLPRLNPRARILEVRQGQVPREVLDPAPAASAVSAEYSGPGGHGHAEGAHGASAAFHKPHETLFDARRVREFFAALHAGTLGLRPWRAKGFFRCAEGWRLFQLSDSGVDESPAESDPGENRCAIIAESLSDHDRRVLNDGLEGCVAAID